MEIVAVRLPRYDMIIEKKEQSSEENLNFNITKTVTQGKPMGVFSPYAHFVYTYIIKKNTIIFEFQSEASLGSASFGVWKLTERSLKIFNLRRQSQV